MIHLAFLPDQHLQPPLRMNESNIMFDDDLTAWRKNRASSIKPPGGGALKRHGLALQSTAGCADPETRIRETLVVACPACGGLHHGVWGAAADCHKVGRDGVATCFDVSARLQCRTCLKTFDFAVALNECGHLEITSCVESNQILLSRLSQTPPDLSEVASKGGEV